MMKKFNIFPSLICVLALFMMQTFLTVNEFAVEPAAEDAITRAQEIVVELEAGIAKAEDLLLQAKASGDDQAYQSAQQAKDAAEQMLAQAKIQLDDAVNMANDSGSAPNDPAAAAASYSSQAKAETSRSFARVGLLYLEALQFAANGELNCSEKINQVSSADKKTWKDLKKLEALAGQSLDYAKSSFSTGADAAKESEKSEKAARECIALARELDMQLGDFEDVCDDFKKRWKEIKDQEDDEKPSPV